MEPETFAKDPFAPNCRSTVSPSVDTERLSLLHQFFSILDEWEKEGIRRAN
jgi:hypothetical protein